jgi:Flp pilus assembly protein TadG
MRNLKKAGKMSLTNRRRGVVAVEMAFIAPLFFLLVFGLVEFARMVMVHDALTDAARIGCRKAVLASTSSQADAVEKVRSSLEATIACVDKCVVAFSPSDLSGVEPGTTITTSVEVKFADVSWIPIPPRLLVFRDKPVVLRGKASMKRE